MMGWVSELKGIAVRLGIDKRIHWTGMLRGYIEVGGRSALRRCDDSAFAPRELRCHGRRGHGMFHSVLISDKVNIWREVKRSGAGLVEPDTLQGTRMLIQNLLELSFEERAQMGHCCT